MSGLLLAGTEVVGIQREEGEHGHLSRPLAEKGKGAVFGAFNAQMLLVPGVELVWIGGTQEETPYTGCSRHLYPSFSA
jgi:hypothetical protein